MKIIIYCSQKYKFLKDNAFMVSFDDNYAQRFIQHIQDNPELCTGCGENCINCRKAYKLNYSSNIAGIYKFPSHLPFYLDNPTDYLPKELPEFDILIAINTHEEILLCLPDLIANHGGKGLIVPSESPEWLSRWTKLSLQKKCDELNIEFAAPKPFCALAPEHDKSVISQFIKYFRVGKPEIELTVRDKKIQRAKVKICAPCGNTIYVAHNIRGKSIDKSVHDWVAKYWHSYPCVASMQFDDELGDTILHKGGYLHYEAFDQAIKTVTNKT